MAMPLQVEEQHESIRRSPIVEKHETIETTLYTPVVKKHTGLVNNSCPYTSHLLHTPTTHSLYTICTLGKKLVLCFLICEKQFRNRLTRFETGQ